MGSVGTESSAAGRTTGGGLGQGLERVKAMGQQYGEELSELAQQLRERGSRLADELAALRLPEPGPLAARLSDAVQDLSPLGPQSQLGGLKEGLAASGLALTAAWLGLGLGRLLGGLQALALTPLMAAAAGLLALPAAALSLGDKERRTSLPLLGAAMGLLVGGAGRQLRLLSLVPLGLSRAVALLALVFLGPSLAGERKLVLAASVGAGAATELALAVAAGPLSVVQGLVGAALLLAETQLALAQPSQPQPPAQLARLHSLAPVAVLVATLAAHAFLALLSPNDSTASRRSSPPTSCCGSKRRRRPARPPTPPTPPARAA